MCGGTRDHYIGTGGSVGLSPRVRGNQSQVAMRRSHRRSIPACAGEPHSIVSPHGLVPVYPRVCGGTISDWMQGGWVGGLSPRVRGNRLSGRSPQALGRSIPACAGEPGGNEMGDVQKRVYPRVCGGTASISSNWSSGTGLSPRVRGNRFGAGQPLVAAGSIPACAGEPRRRRLSRRGGGVYPRVCGGTKARSRCAVAIEGLSPRVRGNPLRSGRDRLPSRSIPACAGEPSFPGACPCRAWVYPRVCGGTTRTS